MRVNEGARWLAPFRFQQDGQRLWASPPEGIELRNLKPETLKL